MDWLIKYKFKNSNNDIFNLTDYMNYLSDKNLSNFEYLNEINEEEFLRDEILQLKLKDYYTFIEINMVEKDLIKIRKEKLDGLVKV